MSIFNRTKPPTEDDNFHKYTEDLIDLTKLREKAMQRAILGGTPEAQAEVERYNTMIEVAQKVILELKGKGSDAN